MEASQTHQCPALAPQSPIISIDSRCSGRKSSSGALLASGLALRYTPRVSSCRCTHAELPGADRLDSTAWIQPEIGICDVGRIDRWPQAHPRTGIHNRCMTVIRWPAPHMPDPVLCPRPSAAQPRTARALLTVCQGQALRRRRHPPVQVLFLHLLLPAPVLPRRPPWQEVPPSGLRQVPPVSRLKPVLG